MSVYVSHLRGRSLVWTCSPVSGSVVTDCALVSQVHSPQRTVSGLERKGCGWCGGETLAL